MVLGVPLEHEWLVLKLRLGTARPGRVWVTISFPSATWELEVEKTLNIYVILNGAQRSEESRPLKNEILRCAQNDK
jgi:hypothetical protein